MHLYSAGEDCGTVGGELGGEGFEGGEAEFVADFADEMDGDVAAVNFFVKGEDIGLYRKGGTEGYGRADADVGHTDESTAERLYLYLVDSPLGDELERLVELHVGGREADSAAEAVAFDDDAMERIPAAKHGCGIIHTAFGDGGAYFRGGNIFFAVTGDAGHHDDLEAKAVGEGKQGCPGDAVGAESVVVADNDGAGSIAAFHVIAKILPGREGAEFFSEMHHFDSVDAHRAEEGLLLFLGGQQPEPAGILLENRPGVRAERNDYGLLSPFTGRGDQCLDYLPVSEVDAVEESCGDYSHLTSSKSCLWGRRGFLANALVATW